MVTYTATRALANAPVRSVAGQAGQLGVSWGTINLAVALATGTSDVVRMCRVPAGSTVIDGLVIAADLDTGAGAMDIDFGWEANGVEAADPDGFGNNGALNGTAVTNYLPVAGIRIPFHGVLLSTGPQFFTRETILTITPIVNASAGGTGQVTMIAYYTCD